MILSKYFLPISSPSFLLFRRHLWHLLWFCFTKRNVPFCCCFFEFPTTKITFYSCVHFLLQFFCYQFLFLSNWNIFCWLHTGSKCQTLLFPFWYFPFLFFFFWRLLVSFGGIHCIHRRLVKSFGFRSSMSCRIKGFSFGLKNFLTNFFMLGNDINIKHPSTTHRALN